MTSISLAEKGGAYLQQLCLEIPGRRVGSVGNQAATDFFSKTVATFGFDIETPFFDCMDWHQEGARLTVNALPFEAFVSPYSLGCRVRALLVVISSMAELEAADLAHAVVLLRGELAREPLMPKNFPFYNPDEHKRIVQWLETKKPQAIIAATSRNAEMAGAVYPFPLIEDGDFDIPSVYMTEEEGVRLAEHTSQMVSLDIRAELSPAKGCNVVARKGSDPHRRIVLFAHIDAKEGTPGALDNASGTAVLLLLSELLADYAGDLRVEIVALNGEDYYDSPGEQLYLRENQDKFGEIVLGVNLDGAGYYHGDTAYSLYGCPHALASQIQGVFSAHPGLVEGEPWYQGDHGLFIMNQVPALAITSERVMDLMTDIVHTPKDRPEMVAIDKLVQIASALRDLILKLDQPLR